MPASSMPVGDGRRILTREDYVNLRSPHGARFFWGKYLCVRGLDGYVECIITETEAYGGARDKGQPCFRQ